MLKLNFYKKNKTKKLMPGHVQTHAHALNAECVRGVMSIKCAGKIDIPPPLRDIVQLHMTVLQGKKKKKERSKSNREAIENVWDGKLSNSVLREKGEMY